MMAETPCARPILIKGETVDKLPEDLYIPPDALEVFLDTFQGPLDLLLYLIKKQNLDVLDIPIADITRQYIHYVELMKHLRIELAADYLLMAAMLAEIKSRMLLPRTESTEDEEEDPRAELVRRLQEYERFKTAAENLGSLPMMGRDTHTTLIPPPDFNTPSRIDVQMDALLRAYYDVMKRAELLSSHQIVKEPLSVRERMSLILDKITHTHFISFGALFTLEEGRSGVVVTFLAILELLKERLIDIVQTEIFGPIHLKAIEYERAEPEAHSTDH